MLKIPYRKRRVPRQREQLSVRIPMELQEWAEREALRQASLDFGEETTLSDIVRKALMAYRESLGEAGVHEWEGKPCLFVSIFGTAKGKKCLMCGAANSWKEPNCGL